MDSVVSLIASHGEPIIFVTLLVNLPVLISDFLKLFLHHFVGIEGRLQLVVLTHVALHCLLVVYDLVIACFNIELLVLVFI